MIPVPLFIYVLISTFVTRNKVLPCGAILQNDKEILGETKSTNPGE